jgi:hypothetical protein
VPLAGGETGEDASEDMKGGGMLQERDKKRTGTAGRSSVRGSIYWTTISAPSVEASRSA